VESFYNNGPATVPQYGQGDLCGINYTALHKIQGGDQSMVWVKPEFVEIRMDAEISAYIFVLE
jgi:hypothetical protein